MVLSLSLYTGGSARLRLESSTGSSLSPNQYSGRYIRYSNWLRLSTELCALSIIGKIQSGTAEAGRANVATPPDSGLPLAAELVGLELEHAAMSRAALAIQEAIAARRPQRRRTLTDIPDPHLW